jgi:hypothetical protein
MHRGPGTREEEARIQKPVARSEDDFAFCSAGYSSLVTGHCAESTFGLESFFFFNCKCAS